MPEWAKVLIGSLALIFGASMPTAIVAILNPTSLIALNQPAPSGRDAQGQHQAHSANEHHDTRAAQQPPPHAPLTQQTDDHSSISAKSKEEGQWYASPDWWTAGFTGALVFVTAGLWFFTALLWRTTRRAVIDGEQAIRAAIATAQAAREQANYTARAVEVSEDTAKRQTRAYVGVNNIILDFAHISYLAWKAPDPLPVEGYIYEDKILVIAKNFGESPAYEVRIEINWQPVGSFGVHPPADYAFPVYAPTASASASQVLDKGHVHTATINVADMWPFQVAEAKLSNLYVYGQILYTDVYGRRWQREYCYVYEPWRREGERFTPHTGHNDETYIEQRQPKLPA
jgi:hypothetical protein